jgi:hypothetical protein
MECPHGVRQGDEGGRGGFRFCAGGRGRKADSGAGPAAPGGGCHSKKRRCGVAAGSGCAPAAGGKLGEQTSAGCRDVAQPGRALAWGARGRQFKSARPDHFWNQPLAGLASLRHMVRRGVCFLREFSPAQWPSAARLRPHRLSSSDSDHFIHDSWIDEIGRP